MKFQMPETLDGLSAAKISELLEAATAEATELNAIADDKITAEESAALIELVGHIGTLADRKAEVDTEAQAAAEALANARAALGERTKPAEKEDEGENEDAEEKPEQEETEEVEDKELVAAKAAGQSFAARAASKPQKQAPKEPEAPKGALSLIAAANISGGFTSGQDLDFDQLAQAFIGRGKAFAGGKAGKPGKPLTPGVTGLPANAERYAVAKGNCRNGLRIGRRLRPSSPSARRCRRTTSSLSSRRPLRSPACQVVRSSPPAAGAHRPSRSGTSASSRRWTACCPSRRWSTSAAA